MVIPYKRHNVCSEVDRKLRWKDYEAYILQLSSDFPRSQQFSRLHMGDSNATHTCAQLVINKILGLRLRMKMTEHGLRELEREKAHTLLTERCNVDTQICDTCSSVIRLQRTQLALPVQPRRRSIAHAEFLIRWRFEEHCMHFNVGLIRENVWGC